MPSPGFLKNELDEANGFSCSEQYWGQVLIV